MSEHEQQVKQVEISIEQAKYTIGLAEELDKLTKNKSFKKVFLERFMEQESQRLVLLRADASQQTPEAQADINKRIDTIGYLNQFMVTIQQQGYLAAQALREDEYTLIELLANPDAE